MSQGYCLPSNPSSCQRFPVVAGEIGTNFQNPLDLQYYNDMAAFFKRQPPTDKYKSAAFSNWFWWAYNAVSVEATSAVACCCLHDSNCLRTASTAAAVQPS